MKTDQLRRNDITEEWAGKRFSWVVMHCADLTLKHSMKTESEVWFKTGRPQRYCMLSKRQLNLSLPAQDNSGLIIALSLRTWAKRTKTLSPHLKFAFLCDYLLSAPSLVHLVLLTTGSEVFYLFTTIWAHSPKLLHCRISKDMMQQYSWIPLDVEVHVIAVNLWNPSR